MLGGLLVPYFSLSFFMLNQKKMNEQGIKVNTNIVSNKLVELAEMLCQTLFTGKCN